MIKIRYPLSGEQHELFNDMVEALCKQLAPYEYKEDNIRCFYCRSDEIDDIYLVYFNYYADAAADIIAHWNGERMSYQIATECKAFIHEPKKSSKDECLSLVSELERYLACVAPHGFMFKGIEGKAEETIAKLKDLILKDNT